MNRISSSWQKTALERARTKYSGPVTMSYYVDTKKIDVLANNEVQQTCELPGTPEIQQLYERYPHGFWCKKMPPIESEAKTFIVPRTEGDKSGNIQLFFYYNGPAVLAALAAPAAPAAPPNESRRQFAKTRNVVRRLHALVGTLVANNTQLVTDVKKLVAETQRLNREVTEIRNEVLQCKRNIGEVAVNQSREDDWNRGLLRDDVKSAVRTVMYEQDAKKSRMATKPAEPVTCKRNAAKSSVTDVTKKPVVRRDWSGYTGEISDMLKMKIDELRSYASHLGVTNANTISKTTLQATVADKMQEKQNSAAKTGAADGAAGAASAAGAAGAATDVPANDWTTVRFPVDMTWAKALSDEDLLSFVQFCDPDCDYSQINRKEMLLDVKLLNGMPDEWPDGNPGVKERKETAVAAGHKKKKLPIEKLLDAIPDENDDLETDTDLESEEESGEESNSSCELLD